MTEKQSRLVTDKHLDEKSNKPERPDDGWPLMLKLFILGSFIMGCYNLIQRDDLNLLIGLIAVVISAPIIGGVGYFFWFMGAMVFEEFYDNKQNFLVRVFALIYSGCFFYALFVLFGGSALL